METSTLIGAKGTWAHGIVPLSMQEIELVAGGKSAVAPTWLEKFLGWVEGLLSSPPASPSGSITIDPSAIGQFQRDCLNAGGDFTFTGVTANGGLSVRVGNVNGSYVEFTVKCDLP